MLPFMQPPQQDQQDQQDPISQLLGMVGGGSPQPDMSAFAPPASPVSPVPGAPPLPPLGNIPGAGPIAMPFDPASLGTAIRTFTPPPPKYPRWFKKPKRPDGSKVHEVGIRKFGEHDIWRNAIQHDLRMLRLDLSGVFIDDMPLVESGVIDPYISTGLIDEFNLACAFIAGIDPIFDKRVFDELKKPDARKVIDAVTWLRKEEEYLYTDHGDMSLRHAEARIYLAYGKLVKRTVVDLNNPDFPFDSALIDPATVVEEYDRHGLSRVWRVYRTTISELARQYGDIPAGAMKKLRNDYGGDIDDDTEITNVVEYWDRWYRCVVAANTEIIPVTAHAYGEVPYTIAYSPLGESLMTHLPDQVMQIGPNGTVVGLEMRKENEAIFKATPYIRTKKISHAMNEATMTRVLHAMRKSMNPSIIRYRSQLISNNGPAPEFDNETPGAVNEAALGEEQLQPSPSPSSPFDVQQVIQAIQTDRATSQMPLSAYGVNDRSNVSGTAIGALNEAGMDKVGPWISSLANFHERTYARWLRMWRNFGYLAKYGEEEMTPLMIPVTKPRRGEEPAFELTTDIIDSVGDRISCRMVNVRKADYLPLIQAGQIAVSAGFMTTEQVAREWLNQPDYERMFEEWNEEQGFRAAMQHPKYAEIVAIPQMLMRQMKEAQNDPEQFAELTILFEKWMEVVANPSMQQSQMEQNMMQAQGQQMMGQMQQPQNPPTAAGVSYPDMGQGPGSVTGQQGGPQGPIAPPQGG